MTSRQSTTGSMSGWGYPSCRLCAPQNRPNSLQTFWYYWGGISLFLFLVQCFTGVLLLVYYRPAQKPMSRSADHLRHALRLADSLSACVVPPADDLLHLVHMFSVYFMKAYRKPREFGWLSGMVLLGIASSSAFPATASNG